MYLLYQDAIYFDLCATVTLNHQLLDDYGVEPFTWFIHKIIAVSILNFLAWRRGFEPLTLSLEGGCSIQLS